MSKYFDPQFLVWCFLQIVNQALFHIASFVSTSLARMRTVIESKQNIEMEEALLKEVG